MNVQHRLDEAAVDRWIERSLRERYAAALREPVPEALLKLLKSDSAGS